MILVHLLQRTRIPCAARSKRWQIALSPRLKVRVCAASFLVTQHSKRGYQAHQPEPATAHFSSPRARVDPDAWRVRPYVGPSTSFQPQAGYSGPCARTRPRGTSVGKAEWVKYPPTVILLSISTARAAQRGTLAPWTFAYAPQNLSVARVRAPPGGVPSRCPLFRGRLTDRSAWPTGPPAAQVAATPTGHTPIGPHGHSGWVHRIALGAGPESCWSFRYTCQRGVKHLYLTPRWSEGLHVAADTRPT